MGAATRQAARSWRRHRRPPSLEWRGSPATSLPLPSGSPYVHGMHKASERVSEGGPATCVQCVCLRGASRSAANTHERRRDRKVAHIAGRAGGSLSGVGLGGTLAQEIGWPSVTMHNVRKMPSLPRHTRGLPRRGGPSVRRCRSPSDLEPPHAASQPQRIRLARKHCATLPTRKPFEPLWAPMRSCAVATVAAAH